MALLDEILAKLDVLPPEALVALEQQRRATAPIWLPNPGWQTVAINNEADEMFFGGEPGGGKALALDTPIPTPSGWTTMGRLRVGSEVFDENGRPTRVVATTPVMIGRPCYRVTFDDGHSVVADAEHLWVTMTADERGSALKLTDEWRAQRRARRPSRAGHGKRRRPDLALANTARTYTYKAPPPPRPRTTAEIAATLFDGKHRNHSVAVCPELTLRGVALPIPPYTLGAWLGDGTSIAPAITSMDPEILAEIGKDGFVLELDRSSVIGRGKARTYRIRRMGQQIQFGGYGGPTSPMSFQIDLKTNRLFGNKHIPGVYLRASRDDRLLLLAGLMDTDGSADQRGKCEFTSTNKALADGVAELLLTLGVKAVVTEGRAMLKGVDCGPKYRVIFTPDMQVFKLPRKAERLRLDRNVRKTQKRRFITSVDSVPSVPVKCIQVAAESHQYLCGRGFIPTHNSFLIVGAAITRHKNAIIFRREFPQIKGLEDAAEAILGSRDGYNASNHVWRIPGPEKRVLEFGSVPFEKDKKRYQGRAHDLKCFDEITQFTKTQYKYLTLWLRSPDAAQRTRIIATGNPPDSPEGLWVIEYWGPWLDPNHPDPAEPGELRWPVPAEEGSDKETFFHSREEAMAHVGQFRIPPVDHEGKLLPPRSRTFVPGKLEENPEYVKSGYQSVLAYTSQDLKDLASGDFHSGLKDHPDQVIPSAWIVSAQQRWTPRPPSGAPMSAIGVDVAQGGPDETVLAPRHDAWYAPLVVVPGKDTPMPSDVAALVVKHRRDQAAVIVDCGGGYGGGVVERLSENSIATVAHKGSTKSGARSKCRQYTFLNKRAEVWWRFREALDPEQFGGSPIELPDEAAVRADLAAPHFFVTPRGIQIEEKEETKKRIGRSPDKGDAIVMAWAEGQDALRRGISGPGAMPRGVGHVHQNRPAFANVSYRNAKRRH